MSSKFHHAALGGTFDRLHIGHQHLIQTAINNAGKVTIGLTTKVLTQSKQLPHLIKSYHQRIEELEKRIEGLSATDQVSIIELNDVYGTTLTDKSIDVIVVTPQTKPGAEKINQLRTKHKLNKLPIITVNLIEDESGDYISSTKIRQGKINRRGQVYAHLFKTDITFTKDQKDQLKKPQGKLLSNKQDIIQAISQSHHTALVGDVITQFAIDHKLPFNLAVVDYMTGRKPFALDLKWWQPDHTIKTQNPPGVITADAAQAIINNANSINTLVEVKGEEDLLGFPAVLALPLRSTVFYGQPQEGVVMMKLSEKVKENLARFIL